VSPGPLTQAILDAIEMPGPIHDPFWDQHRGMYFDRERQPLTFRQWTALWGIRDYQILKQTESDIYWISTIWTGTSLTGNARNIFETMVFSTELSFHKAREAFELNGIKFPPMPEFAYHVEHEQWRYDSQEQALEGHAILVAQVKAMEALMGQIDPRN
jgi:hypothetical protein